MSESNLTISRAKYSIGDLVHHVLFDYRGVIVDIDANFQLTDEWYENVARSNPPKNEPWYHVLVHNAINSTYVAEQNLEADTSSMKINHPLISSYFSELQNGSYVNNQKFN